MPSLLLSRRRWFLVAGGLLAVYLIAFLAHNAWRRSHPAPSAYNRMVSAFFSGVAALDAGNDDLARSRLTAATRLAPQEPAAWADLGLCYLRHRDFDHARKALEQAHDLAPGNGQILLLLGQLEARQGHSGEALSDYKQAALFDPTNLRAHYALADAIEKQSGADAEGKAREQRQAIYDAAPDNLFAELTLADDAAQAGDAAQLRQVMARIAGRSASWPPALHRALQTAQADAAGANPRAAISSLRGLKNELTPTPQYQNDAAKIHWDSRAPGVPLRRFLVLPNPPAALTAPAQP